MCIYDTCPRSLGWVSGVLCDFHNYDTMRHITESRSIRHQTLDLGYHTYFYSLDHSYFNQSIVSISVFIKIKLYSIN